MKLSPLHDMKKIMWEMIAIFYYIIITENWVIISCSDIDSSVLGLFRIHLPDRPRLVTRNHSVVLLIYIYI